MSLTGMRPRFQPALSVSCSILLAAIASSVALAQPNPLSTIHAPSNDVSFTISLPQTIYQAGQPVTVHYQITNISNAPLYVPLGFDVTACLYIGPPHIWGDFENSAGKHYLPGYALSCAYGLNAPKPTLTERMQKGSVLLHPGEHHDGTYSLDTAMFGLQPGAYRVEMVLRGWDHSLFPDADWLELTKLGIPFLSGEVPASTHITLTQ